MKKVIGLAVVMALSLSNVADAKRGGGMKVMKRPTTQQQKAKPDADFNTTPPAPNAGAAQVQQAQGNRLGNFVTGAAAGYLLSDMLSPTEAQAQETAKPAEQAVAADAKSANPVAQLNQQVQQVPTIQAFKAIDPQDPNLIEKTAGYSRYCLNGVQYLISATQNQLPPTLLVDKNNAPVQCIITP